MKNNSFSCNRAVTNFKISVSRKFQNSSPKIYFFKCFRQIVWIHFFINYKKFLKKILSFNFQCPPKNLSLKVYVDIRTLLELLTYLRVQTLSEKNNPTCLHIFAFVFLAEKISFGSLRKTIIFKDFIFIKQLTWNTWTFRDSFIFSKRRKLCEETNLYIYFIYKFISRVQIFSRTSKNLVAPNFYHISKWWTSLNYRKRNIYSRSGVKLSNCSPRA